MYATLYRGCLSLEPLIFEILRKKKRNMSGNFEVFQLPKIVPSPDLVTFLIFYPLYPLNEIKK